MDVYDCYMRSSGQETSNNQKVIHAYNQVRVGVGKQIKQSRYYYTFRCLSVDGDQVIEMLKEDGFCVKILETNQTSVPNQNEYLVDIRWNSNAPGVMFAVDGPEYNKNIIT